MAGLLGVAERAIACARGGGGSSLFIVGPAGLGKTTALRRTVEAASLVGLRTIESQGVAMERSLPLGLFRQILAATAGSGDPESDALANGLGGPDLIQRLLPLINRLGTEPTLIAIDDLHWADPESLRLLAYLCRRIRSHPVAVVATLRPWPGEAVAVCLDLTSNGQAVMERLQPMTHAAAAAMVSARVGRELTQEAAEELWTLSGGNPMLLVEAVELIAQSDDDGGGQVEVTGILPETTVHSVLAGLPADAVRCAHAVSIFSGAFRSEIGVEVAQLGETEGEMALDALFRSGVLREGSDRALEFVHPLLRRTLYQRLSPPVRARWHARAFTALCAHGFESQAVEHAIKADLTGDAETINLLTRIANKAIREGAMSDAVENFRAAVTVAGDTAGVDLRLALGQALLAAGRPVAAASVLRRLLTHGEVPSEGAAQVAMLRALGMACEAAGRQRSAVTHFAAAAEVSRSQDPTMAAEALIDQALVGWQLEGMPSAMSRLLEAEKLAAIHGETGTLRRLRACTAYLRVLQGDPEGMAELEEIARAALADASSRRHPLPPLIGVELMFAQAAIAVGRLGDADQFLESALMVSRHSRVDLAPAPLMMVRADVLIRLGRLAEGLAVAASAVAASASAPGPNVVALAIMAHALLQLGLGDESEDACRQAGASVRDDQGLLAMLWIGHVRGQRRLLAGDAAEASRQYVQVERIARRLGLAEPCVVPWAIHALLAHVDSGDVEGAEALMERLTGSAPGLPCSWLLAAVATGRAVIAERRHEPSAAEAEYQLALALTEAEEGSLDRILVLWRFGGFLRRSGRQTDARRVLADGLRAAEATGAIALARPLGSELNVAGGRRSRRGSPGDPLTAQENRVVDLVASGKTNREIAASLLLSINTVETHVQRAYAKLGVHARRRLLVKRQSQEGGAGQ